MDCAELSISIYIKIGGGSTGLSETGYPGNYRFSGRKKILAEVKRIKGIRLARHPEAFEKKDYMAATRELADELMEDF